LTRSILRRIARLEAEAWRIQSLKDGTTTVRDADLAAAARALFDVLEEHYPNEEHGQQFFWDKLRAAAIRAQARAPTDADRAALAALPARALMRLNMSATDALISAGLGQEAWPDGS
jgi:hypothetical protein